MVCRDFCIKTEAWIEELDPIDVEDGETEYTLNPKCNAYIHRIIEVRYGTTATDDDTIPLEADDYSLSDDSKIILADEPEDDITDGLVVTVVLRPIFNDDIDLPDWFLDRYGDTLTAGLKFRLMRMQRKPWTNYEMAQYYEMEYAKGKAIAVREKYAEYKNISLVAERPSFV